MIYHASEYRDHSGLAKTGRMSLGLSTVNAFLLLAKTFSPILGMADMWIMQTHPTPCSCQPVVAHPIWRGCILHAMVNHRLNKGLPVVLKFLIFLIFLKF